MAVFFNSMMVGSYIKVFTAWNPSDKGAGCALSNLNLTTVFSSPGSVRSVIAKSSGKWYWEVTVGSPNNSVVGVANSSALMSQYCGSNINSWGWYVGGNVLNNGSFVNNGADTYTTGDVLGIALDMDAKTMQCYKNGVSSGTAITGLSATMYACVGSGGAPTGNTTNFGASAFSYTPPSGFNSGLYI